MNIYFSAPQNTSYQQNFVNNCAALLGNSGFEVFLAADPHFSNPSAYEQTRESNGEPLISDETNPGRLRKSAYANQVFADNIVKLIGSEALVALLDGSQVDDRVACEIGIFYGLMRTDPTKKGILGLTTDIRCLGRRDSNYGINIFTLGTLEEVGEVKEDLDGILERLIQWKNNDFNDYDLTR